MATLFACSNFFSPKDLESRAFIPTPVPTPTAIIKFCTGKASDTAVRAFLILGIIFSRRFFQWQTDIKDIVDGGYSYLIIVTTCSFGMYGQIVFEKLMQSTGKTIFSMTTQLTGAIVNIVLDPILIFGLFGFPKLGISGAAIATVIGQICGIGLAIYTKHRHKYKALKFKINAKNCCCCWWKN